MKVKDIDGNTPINYALSENHFKLLPIFKKYAFEEKLQKEPSQGSPNNKQHHNIDEESNGNVAAIANNMKLLQISNGNFLTPNNTQFDYENTSPFYVNMKCSKGLNKKFEKVAKNAKEYPNGNNATEEQNGFLHSEKSKIPTIIISNENGKIQNKHHQFRKTISVDTLIDEVIEISSESEEDEETVTKTNLFELTEENVERYLSMTPKKNRISLVNTWRNKVNKTITREKESPSRENEIQLRSLAIQSNTGSSSGQSVQTIVEANPKDKDLNSDSEGNESFFTAIDENGGVILVESELKFIENADKNINIDTTGIVLQTEEKYQHIDTENNVVFYENKMIANGIRFTRSIDSNVIELNTTTETGTCTTENAIPSDYDTDDLRQELKIFGDKPGPITKNTKRLYLRRLFRYKKRPKLIGINEKNSNIRSK